VSPPIEAKVTNRVYPLNGSSQTTNDAAAQAVPNINGVQPIDSALVPAVIGT
jgi:hypothetical protein